jgi:hypothetical protein
MARGMYAGIKIYKLDNHNNSVNNEMLAFIASLEISDIYNTLNRCKSAYRSLEETREMRHYYSCFYETSNMLEHLNAINKYKNKIENKKDELSQTILNMRNHIRHDICDNIFDDNSENNKKRREKRAKELGIGDGLLVHVGFDIDAIKVGDTELTFSQIEKFLERSQDIFNQHTQELVRDGRLSIV